MNDYEIEFTQMNFGGKRKDCIIVDVDEADYQLCDTNSRGTKFWGNSKPGKYGKGLGRTKNDEYKTARTGYLGEVGFGKIFNLPADLSYKHGGDEQDNLFRNFKIDIKCAMRNRGLCNITHTTTAGKRLFLDKDIYVISFIVNEDRVAGNAKIMFVGYNNQEGIEKCAINPGLGGGNHLNYDVTYQSVKSMKSLIELRNQINKLPIN